MLGHLVLGGIIGWHIGIYGYRHGWSFWPKTLMIGGVIGFVAGMALTVVEKLFAIAN